MSRFGARARAIGIMAAASLVASCGVSAPTSGPSESIPPAPSAPEGWRSVVAFGGSGGAGFVGAANVGLDAPRTAVAAACSGSGTLVVLIGPDGEGEPAARPAAVFACGTGTPAAGRVELAGMPLPQVATIRATVIEGAATLRHAAFTVSIEQKQ